MIFAFDQSIKSLFSKLQDLETLFTSYKLQTDRKLTKIDESFLVINEYLNCD